MFSNRPVTSFGCLVVVLATLCSCTASPASKVQCESNLRPINPASLENPQP
jgi:hypothetical protein